jgi:hypothetical protein
MVAVVVLALLGLVSGSWIVWLAVVVASRGKEWRDGQTEEAGSLVAAVVMVVAVVVMTTTRKQ